MTYKEIIDKQVERLPYSQNWWPKYFYHFTNIENAIGIIEKGCIFGRQTAVENSYMQTDNASPSVISVSQNKIKEYARLYFRPKTPTQYHNEGYKPQHIRDDVNASCPVPVFFFLDSLSVLNIPGVEFSEVSCAGYCDINLMSGEESFAKLPFDKIYHNRFFSTGERDDIIQHRHAEVVRLGALPIRESLRGIFCRSVAEKQTLLHLLYTRYPDLYSIYRNEIRYSPQLDLFYNNGVFIKEVNFHGNSISVTLNEPYKRYATGRSIGNDFNFRAFIHYLDDNSNIFERAEFTASINYAKHNSVDLDIGTPKSRSAVVDIYFDDVPMYSNEMRFDMEHFI